jgi:hypothetical protein
VALAFPDEIGLLAEVDPQALSPSRYRALRTRAGHARLREMQALLAHSDEQPTLDEEMAELLAAALSSKLPPAECARRLRARVSGDRFGALARATREDLEESLGQAAEDFPALGQPGALPFALAVQEALRKGDAAAPLVAIGWLVRAAGPGRRGETLRIGTGRCRIGKSAACQLRLEGDDRIQPDHAEMSEQGGQFVIAPADGRVRVEGAEIAQPRALVDGEVIELGTGRYVFKSVT